jgi:DNA-binding NarL/FixJ family response regulator
MTAEPPVVFVDDHRMFGEPLTAMLAPRLRERGFAVRAAVRAADEVPATDVPGVAVCDVRLRAGGPSGAAAVRLLTERGWRALLVSGEAPAGQVLAAIAAGARGYVPKSVDPGDLLAAIVAVAEDGRHLSFELARMLYADLRHRPLPPDAELGHADRALLRAVTAGESPARAAAGRGMSGQELRRALARVFAAETRRWDRYALTDREIEVAKAFGCHHARDAAEAAELLHLAKDTVNDHLKSLRKKYLDTHPDGGAAPKQQTTAWLWTIELGLCPEDDEMVG